MAGLHDNTDNSMSDSEQSSNVDCWLSGTENKKSSFFGPAAAPATAFAAASAAAPAAAPASTTTDITHSENNDAAATKSALSQPSVSTKKAPLLWWLQRGAHKIPPQCVLRYHENQFTNVTREQLDNIVCQGVWNNIKIDPASIVILGGCYTKENKPVIKWGVLFKVRQDQTSSKRGKRKHIHTGELSDEHIVRPIPTAMYTAFCENKVPRIKPNENGQQSLLSMAKFAATNNNDDIIHPGKSKWEKIDGKSENVPKSVASKPRHNLNKQDKSTVPSNVHNISTGEPSRAISQNRIGEHDGNSHIFDDDNHSAEQNNNSDDDGGNDNDNIEDEDGAIGNSTVDAHGALTPTIKSSLFTHTRHVNNTNAPGTIVAVGNVPTTTDNDDHGQDNPIVTPALPTHNNIEQSIKPNSFVTSCVTTSASSTVSYTIQGTLPSKWTINDIPPWATRMEVELKFTET